MREPSASQLTLAAHCAHAFTSGIRWPPEDWSGFSEFGKRVHLAAEGLTTGAAVYPAAYADLDAADVRKVDRCVEQIAAVIDAERVTGWQWVEAEHRLAYNVETGEVRETLPGLPKRRGEWTVEIDLVFQRADGLVVVWDYKTGRQQYTDDARDNWQVRLGALAMARRLGATAVRVELLYVDEDRVWRDAADFDELDLEEIAAEMRDLRHRLTGGPTPPVPGAHCTQHYCKLRGVCAATVGALATVMPAERPLTVDIRDVEHARWIRERLPGAEEALKAIKAALAEFARHTPVPMGDGKIYAWREKSEREVKITRADQVEALAAVLGEHARVAVEPRYHVTLESLKEAARTALAARGQKRGLAKLVDEACAALETVGAFKVNTWSAPGEFAPDAGEERKAS